MVIDCPVQKYQICYLYNVFLDVCRGIVVLAQQTKTWMDSEVQTALRGYNITWQTREGAPYSANDLSRVSAGDAESIILLRPENSRASLNDILKITLFSLIF